MLDLIEQFDTKIEYARTMHNAIRQRQLLLLSMLVIEDPFELDDKIQEFYEVAYDYRQARSALLALPMSKEEEAIHHLLDKQALLSQPENRRAVEMFTEERSKEEIIKVINVAQKYQAELLQTLQRFVALQKSKDKDVTNFSRQQFDDSIYWISLLGLIAFIITALISRYVGKAVAEKNLQLLQAGEDMARAYKRAEQATVIKSEFLATMSHEIRTPLTAIIGFAETTLFSEQTMEQRQNAIQTIIRSGKHLLQVINDILDLSKVEANKLEMEHVELSPFEMLADVERLVRPAAEEKGLGFSINYIFPLPKKIKTDSLRVKQILINLCNNAIKFTEQGYVLINVSCNCDPDDSRLFFEVVDSGIGITKEQQELIFQAYRQADSSTTRKFGGTGLGLSLSKLLAEKLGGALAVESEPGKGSQFKFSLDFEMLADTDIVFDKDHLPGFHKKKAQVLPIRHLSGHVLLAEDNLDNQQLLSIYLRRIGVDVTIVDNGRLAVEATKENDYDLVLMDMRMPVMGGLEAIKILRAMNFEKPIIALTANAMQEDKAACFKAGCDSFLTKPIDATMLSETLEKYIDIKTTEKTQKKPVHHQQTSLVSSILESDPEAIELIKRFVYKLTDTLKEIEKSIQAHDWENLSDILHQLKGSGGNFGYPNLTSIAGKMEFQVVNENQDELNTLLAELQESHQQILSGLETA